MQSHSFVLFCLFFDEFYFLELPETTFTNSIWHTNKAGKVHELLDPWSNCHTVCIIQLTLFSVLPNFVKPLIYPRSRFYVNYNRGLVKSRFCCCHFYVDLSFGAQKVWDGCMLFQKSLVLYVLILYITLFSTSLVFLWQQISGKFAKVVMVSLFLVPLLMINQGFVLIMSIQPLYINFCNHVKNYSCIFFYSSTNPN